MLWVFFLIFEFLQSVNGVYINNVKIPPSTPTPIKLGDEVCFGVNLNNNEFRYALTTKEGRHFLQRCGGFSSPVSVQVDGDETPPTGSPAKATTAKSSSQLQRRDPGKVSINERDKTPPTGSPTHSPVAKRAKRFESQSQTQEVLILEIFGCSEESNPANEDIDGTKTPPQSEVVGSPPKKAAVLKPSPALSAATISPATSQLSVEDALFPDEPLTIQLDPISDALFGEEEPRPSEALKKLEGADSATIQIELAKEEMAKEKHQLLSSIEALRSELAAKEQFLVRRKLEGEEEAASKATESMLSTMQEEFTCVICQELFVNAYTLPCSHSYCEWCIKEWMKCKRQRECPICRTHITSDPVHSRALDNAISKRVEKMSQDAQEERKSLLKQHAESLKKLGAPSAAESSKSTTLSYTASSATRSAVTTRSRAPGGHIGPGSSSTRPIVIDDAISVGPRVFTISHDEEEDSSDEEDFSDEEDSDSYDDGLPGAYYGGHGRCFHCGQLAVDTLFLCICRKPA